jgi:type 1 glutamine amidotransferase
MLKFEGFPERQGLLEFVRGGKGLAGQHWATDNFRDWPEAAEHLFGAVMNGHPFYFAQVRNEVQSSPLTAMFPAGGFPCHEEYYIFTKKDHRSEPRFKQTYDRSKLRVLLSIDVEKSPAVQKTIADIAQDTKSMYHNKLSDDNDYALSWIRREGEGRVFYTVFGHDKSAYWNPAMVRHFMAGVQYAMGDLSDDDSPSCPAGTGVQAAGGTVKK